MREHNPKNPPKKPGAPQSTQVRSVFLNKQCQKMKLGKEELKKRIASLLYTVSELNIQKEIHTEVNSKAEGYIRSNCETQSTHCIINPRGIITLTKRLPNAIFTE